MRQLHKGGELLLDNEDNVSYTIIIRLLKQTPMTEVIYEVRTHERNCRSEDCFIRCTRIGRSFFVSDKPQAREREAIRSVRGVNLLYTDTGRYET